MSSRKHVKPQWLEEWRRRTKIISIIERAFEIDCDCEICEAVRELGMEMEDMMQFTPPEMPVALGGEGTRAKRRRRK